MKRVFDLVMSTILCVFLLPVAFLILVVYLFFGQWSVLFKQRRLGHHEIPFTMLKFRTLSKEEHLSLEERSFALGNWLRKTSLDELPQLINVVKGDMSLVGPRPLPTYYEPLFSEEQRRRFQVKPGMTGLTQIKGGSDLSWLEKFNYDIEYVNSQSIWGDISIMFKTISVILKRKNNGLQEKPFTGNS